MPSPGAKILRGILGVALRGAAERGPLSRELGSELRAASEALL